MHEVFVYWSLASWHYW